MLEKQCCVEGCYFERFVFETRPGEIKQTSDKCIFHCEKDDWFDKVVNNKGDVDRDWTKSWDNGKIKQFWAEIRTKKMKKQDYHFSEYIFPEFDECYETDILDNDNDQSYGYLSGKRVNFWKKKDKLEFTNRADFSYAKFLGYTDFQYVIFAEGADFTSAEFWNLTFFDALFSEETFFREAIFSQIAIFEDASFSSRAYFKKARFLGETSFFGAEFLENADFTKTTIQRTCEFTIAKFEGNTLFEKAEFFEEANFFQANFSGKADFDQVKFSGKVNLDNVQFADKASFNQTIFSKGVSIKDTTFAGGADFVDTVFSEQYQTLFQNIAFSLLEKDLKDKPFFPHACFINIFFPSSVLFRRCDLSRVSFLDADVDQVRFYECDFGYLSPKYKGNNFLYFGKSESRKILFDELLIQQQKKPPAKHFENVETRYRQLKKNFEDKKDWETAGDFYHGEMTMRLKKYCAERKEKVLEAPWWPPVRVWNGIFYNNSKIFFFWCYRLISDFNEGPGRALLCLFILIAFFCFCFWLLLSDFGKAFHYALTSAVPLYEFPANLDANLGWKGIGLHYVEVFLSTIVWTLLVLSVRQKFRR